MNWEDIYSPAELAEQELILAKEARQDRIMDQYWKRVLKPLINTRHLWRWLNENDSWQPIGIVELQITTKRNHYYNKDMPHGKVVGDDSCRFYPEMHHQRERGREVPANHIFIWQTNSYPCEDCYSGYIAIPLKNRKYFLISYSC